MTREGTEAAQSKGLRMLAAVVFALTILFFFMNATLLILAASAPMAGGSPPNAWGDISFLAMLFAFSTSGLLIARRQPRNAIGWIMLAIGVVGMQPLLPYGEYALSRGGMPLDTIAIALDQGSWVPVIGLAGPMLILLFPTGRPATPRWRWAVWFTAISMVLIWFLVTSGPGPFEEGGVANGLQNPLGIEALRPLLGVLLVTLLFLPIAFVLSLISLVLRYRRSRGIERQQLKWLTAAVAIVTFLYSLAMILSLAGSWGGENTPTWMQILQNVAILSFLLIPLSIGLSVVKYHLYDIDVVINKALVFGVIIVFITTVYVGVIVGIGAVIGAGDNTLLAVVATAIVAIAFQPMRKRAHLLANRLVYGKQRTKEEVLATYLPQGVADRLVAGEDQAQQEELVATVLFSDLRGFTALAERLSPRALVDLVGLHLSAMAEVVQAHGGSIDKFQGDAVMAVFGVTPPQPDHAGAALRCALAMQTRQAELNRELDSRSEELLHMGIGVNTGTVIAGTIGGGGRFEFTVVGDAVNIAQRLQGEAEGGEILAGANTIATAGAGIASEPAGLLQVKGREAPVDAYRVTGTREPAIAPS